MSDLRKLTDDELAEVIRERGREIERRHQEWLETDAQDRRCGAKQRETKRRRAAIRVIAGGKE